MTWNILCARPSRETTVSRGLWDSTRRRLRNHITHSDWGRWSSSTEELRLANYFPPSIREKLGAPDSDFTLEKTAGGQWRFRPVRYQTHKVVGMDGRNDHWKVENKFHKQPLKVRIEALMSLAPYEGNGEAVATFDTPNEFSLAQASEGAAGSMQSVSTPVKAGTTSGCFSAKSGKTNGFCAWAMAGKQFMKPVNLLEKGFGVWVFGDGKGEVLNFQWRAPEHISSGLSEHYAVIDFTGWRYFEFVEPESDRLMDYGWPYFYASPDKEFGGVGGIKHFNRFTGTCWVDYGKLDSLKLWYNHIPKGEEVRCYLSPIKALPHVKAQLTNPSIAIGGQTISFPTTLESGCYLEYRSGKDCKVYDAKGDTRQRDQCRRGTSRNWRREVMSFSLPATSHRESAPEPM